MSKINKALDFCESTQVSISRMLDASKGIVSTNLIHTMESSKESIERIAAEFGEGMSEEAFDKVF